ncbi:MAG: PRC-barrel domain-containing protein [Candidatus Hadarchaeales archaeon]
MTQLLAGRLRSLIVISDRGLQLGRLNDILFEEESGKILFLLVRPLTKETLKGVPQDNSGNAMIPFSAVMSIRDFIVVNERVLAIQQLKGRQQEVPSDLGIPGFEPKTGESGVPGPGTQ